MNSNEARETYTAFNNDGHGFALTGHQNALVIDEIAEAGLTVTADHGDGLTECRDAQGRVLLVGGDGRRRNAWAVRVSR